MRTALFLLVFFAAPYAHGREWSSAAGKIEGEFQDCDVNVRLPSGKHVSIPFSDLSENDKAFVLDELRNAGHDAGPSVLPEVAKTLEKNIATLQQQIAAHAPSGEIKKTLDAIRAADPAFKQLEPIVKKLLDTGNQLEVMAGLTILGEFKISDAWLIEKLLSLEQEYRRGLLNAFDSFESMFFNDIEYAKLMNSTVQPYRRVIGLLSEQTERDRRVKDLLETRISALQSDPEPKNRASAALGLTGARAMSAKVVPLMTNAMKKDASSVVQMAAGLSLGGFDGNANGLVQSLIDSLVRSHANVFYLSALIDSSADSPLLRKVLKRMFDSYRSSDDPDNFIAHACAVLTRNGQDNTWAIVELTDCCQVSLGREHNYEFESLRNALLMLGRTDPRVLKFFEKQAREGPEWARVDCDSAAKQVATNIRATK